MDFPLGRTKEIELDRHFESKVKQTVWNLESN